MLRMLRRLRIPRWMLMVILCTFCVYFTLPYLISRESLKEPIMNRIENEYFQLLKPNKSLPSNSQTKQSGVYQASNQKLSPIIENLVKSKETVRDLDKSHKSRSEINQLNIEKNHPLTDNQLNIEKNHPLTDNQLNIEKNHPLTDNQLKKGGNNLNNSKKPLLLTASDDSTEVKQIQIANHKPNSSRDNPFIVNQTASKSVQSSVYSDNIALKNPIKSENRLILAWTHLHSKKPLWSLSHQKFKNCVYKNCEVTGNRSLLADADLLLFRIRELKKDHSKERYRPYVHPIDFTDLPPYHRRDQMWVDINQESPVHTHADEEVSALDGMFNLSANYMLASDYPLSYIPLLRKRGKPITTNVNYAAGKTKMALWFVSHCGAGSGRDEYVQEMQKYNITVDIFGKCTGLSDGCAAGNTTCYAEVRKKYKFYLAFENSICNEYITEKFWNTLRSDSFNIPIALGASLRDYEKFSPPDSYLHTRNFTSIKHLAEFMHKIDKDNQAFNRYHKWRETYEFYSRDRESLPCWLCRSANEKKDGNPQYKQLSKYWSRKNNCEDKPESLG